MFSRSLAITPLPDETFEKVEHIVEKKAKKKAARRRKNELDSKVGKKVSDAEVSGEADVTVKRKRKNVGKVGK